MTPRGAWTTAYFVGWAMAMAPVGCVTLIACTADLQYGSDMWWWAGAFGGAVVGLAVAAATRGLGALHRPLRLVGPLMFVGGVVAAVSMFYESGVQHRTGQFLGGFGEFLFALLWLAVASTGGGLWLAGVSGRRAMAK